MDRPIQKRAKHRRSVKSSTTKPSPIGRFHPELATTIGSNQFQFIQNDKIVKVRVYKIHANGKLLENNQMI